jgi:Leucine-rich repeat (LRR) protein
MKVSQAQHLTAGGPAAAAAPAGVLAATLGRLRCLCVTDIQDSSQLAHLGRLLGAATGLTQLVVKTNGDSVTITPASLLEGLNEAQAGASATSAAAAEAEPAAAAAAAAAARGWLPALRHLQLPGRLLGLLEAWLPQAGSTSQLTALRVTCGAWTDTDLDCLAACVGLRELVVQGDVDGWLVQFPEDLSQLTALSKLELCRIRLREVPEAVWRLTQLRHLSLGGNDDLRYIPDDISRLCQLQQLGLSSTGVEELPEELGTWLPQLVGLDIDHTNVEAVPLTLTRLTELCASGSGIQQVSELTHLVGIKHLDMYSSRLQPPFADLSRLSALQTLCFGWDDELSEEDIQQVAVPGPMPDLRSLTLSGDGPVLVQQLQAVMGAQQLTYLDLYPSVDPEQLPALGQLPQLRQLVIGGEQSKGWGGALPWLQQQPQLTSLSIISCHVEGSQLEQLPGGLEQLHLSWCRLAEGQPGALTQLSRLRSLRLAFTDIQRLPPWLPSLQHLEELDVTSCSIGPDDWEVLGQLPLLRRVRVSGGDLIRACLSREHAPHLCWCG